MRIGHASINENGKTTGGIVGDQNGKEVCIRSWYAKNWTYLLRCKDSKLAEKMAVACEQGCNNNYIGYDQNRRNTLEAYAIQTKFDLSKINTPCATDCSAFMTVCAECAGIPIPYNGYNAPTTRTMKQAFTKTGLFDVLTDKKYLTQIDYLKRGDILVAEGHHTVMVLDNGKLEDTPKVIDIIAKEVINGLYGSGMTRKLKLEQAGYSYELVQKRVNEILKGK